MINGIRVATVEEIPEGEGIAVSRELTGTDDDIAILRDEDGSVWALNDTCTHQTASLAEGWVENGHVECPLHSSKFCLRSGTVDGLPATRDTVAHRLEVRDGEIYLYPNERP
ncbi:non-heme iron oxygenase ferredoxin subunit [Nocardioides sp. LS1]|uniref:non-heme iron oxygenase ferredoxin subunit n=1 Tax=Nocardioides sp. LS1 TaxID=1027620 RepID=UPI000F61F9AC|nr:non-heme iron oxygenase ferredoxin subunit [Nocardioides sp. LS1]GCD88633.1 putative ferredoxin subunit of phenylpropionate dioxygenase [Nocardioides sp. LS1]